MRDIDAGSINIDFNTLVTTEKYHTGVAVFSINDGENDRDTDLFNMSSLSVPTGMGNGRAESEAVYTKIESTRRKLSGGMETVWKGSLSDSNRFGFATLIQNSDSLAGTFSTETSAFVLTKTHDGNLQLKETFWKDDLDSGSVELDEIVPEVSDLGDSIFEETLFASMVVEMPKVEDSITSIGKNVFEGQHRMLRDGDRSLLTLTNVDVLVLVSNRAMCESAGLTYGCDLTDDNRAPIEGMIKVVEEETNSAMQSVGASSSVTFVRIIHVSADFDGRPSGDTLQLIRNSATIAGWRAEVGADLVHMVTGDDPNNKVAGLSYLNNPESASRYVAIVIIL